MSKNNTMPSPSYSFIVRLKIKNESGMLSKVLSKIANQRGSMGAIDLVRVEGEYIVRDLTIYARNFDHQKEIIENLKDIPGVEFVNASDRTFLYHLGGKLEVKPRRLLKTRDDLSMAYTPGVARICKAIEEDVDKSFNLTIKGNTVAIVTDGSAVLGLGNIGPEAAMPVMEGKAMIFNAFANVDAFPICLNTQDVDEIIKTVESISPTFGGINLEDISAPRCFLIERELQKRVDIPVFHDDQHGTAIVVLAALINALRIVGKKMNEIKVTINGAGAGGAAVAKLLLKSGIKNIIMCDRKGAIYKGRREHMNFAKEEIATKTNPENCKGTLKDAIKGADVFIGLSSPGVVTTEMLKTMSKDPIVFALANPVPEIMPEEARKNVRIMATGRSDYPNQINNALVFPGFFRGLLDVRARKVVDEMKISTAKALAQLIKDNELNEDYIIPSIFNKNVVNTVSSAVKRVAVKRKLARRILKIEEGLMPE